jgi:hypothetical protein
MPDAMSGDAWQERRAARSSRRLVLCPVEPLGNLVSLLAGARRWAFDWAAKIELLGDR